MLLFIFPSLSVSLSLCLSVSLSQIIYRLYLYVFHQFENVLEVTYDELLAKNAQLSGVSTELQQALAHVQQLETQLKQSENLICEAKLSESLLHSQQADLTTKLHSAENQVVQLSSLVTQLQEATVLFLLFFYIQNYYLNLIYLGTTYIRIEES